MESIRDKSKLQIEYPQPRNLLSSIAIGNVEH